MKELLQEIVQQPASSLLVIANLVLIESLLSVDNAAVLATMVLDLPKAKRRKALKYGIIGAYIFRGLCLLFASLLVKIWWLKPLGGIYLVYLFIDWLRERLKKNEGTPEQAIVKHKNKFYRMTVGRLGNFWATVAMVELMDLAFSIDNVFAAVAFSKNILLIWLGVFIGILAMRFVAQGFVALMERFPFLETCAYAVICLLGLKLAVAPYQHFYPERPISRLLESQQADWITSGITISIFIIPIITSLLFNFPKRQKSE